MQISQNTNNFSDPQQQPYAQQAAQFIDDLTEIHAKVVSPPPDEVLQLIGRLEDAQSKDKTRIIANPGALHRISSILYRKPGSTMGELSRALSLPLYTVTRMVDSLVESGLADRLSDPNDRRIVRVTLTDDGLRLHEAIEAHLVQSIQRIMACLTVEEQRILTGLFRKIRASLKEPRT